VLARVQQLPEGVPGGERVEVRVTEAQHRGRSQDDVAGP